MNMYELLMRGLIKYARVLQKNLKIPEYHQPIFFVTFQRAGWRLIYKILISY